MRFQGATRTEPDVRLSRIRLPPWLFDGEALVGPGVEDAGFGEPVVGERPDLLPGHSVFLAAPPPPPRLDQSRSVLGAGQPTDGAIRGQAATAAERSPKGGERLG
jgi:hypothetical protein